MATPQPVTVKDRDEDYATVDTFRSAASGITSVRIEVRQFDRESGDDEIATVIYNDEQAAALIDALTIAREHAKEANAT